MYETLYIQRRTSKILRLLISSIPMQRWEWKEWRLRMTRTIQFNIKVVTERGAGHYGAYNIEYRLWFAGTGVGHMGTIIMRREIINPGSLSCTGRFKIRLLEPQTRPYLAVSLPIENIFRNWFWFRRNIDNCFKVEPLIQIENEASSILLWSALPVPSSIHIMAADVQITERFY